MDIMYTYRIIYWLAGDQESTLLNGFQSSKYGFFYVLFTQIGSHILGTGCPLSNLSLVGLEPTHTQRCQPVIRYATNLLRVLLGVPWGPSLFLKRGLSPMKVWLEIRIGIPVDMAEVTICSRNIKNTLIGMSALYCIVYLYSAQYLQMLQDSKRY